MNASHITNAASNADLTTFSTASITLPARSCILVSTLARVDVGATIPIVTLADTTGLIWTEIKTQTFDGNASRASLWAAMTGSTAITTVLTVTWASTVRGTAIMADAIVDGGPIVRAAAGTPGVAAASATVAFGVTTAGANYVYAVAAIGRSDRNIVPQTGWTELGEQTIVPAGGRTGDIETHYFAGSETDISASISSGTTPWGMIGAVIAPRTVHSRTHGVLSTDHYDVDAADVPTAGDRLMWDGTKWIAYKPYYESNAAPVVTDSDFPAAPSNGETATTHNTTTGEDRLWVKTANAWVSFVLGTTSPPVQPGGAFGIATTTAPLTGEPTNWGLSPHRVMWWNSFKSRWDSVLPVATAGGAAVNGDWHIVGGVTGNTPSLKNLIVGGAAGDAGAGDASKRGRPDIIWDEANLKLYVAIHRSLSGGFGGTMFVYSYNQTSDTYTLLRSSAMGINLAGGDAGAVVMKSPNGRLWIAGNDSTGALRINQSTDDGATWGTPFSLKTTLAIGKSGLSWFINGGVTYVWVMTAENGIAVDAPNTAKYYAFRIQQDAAYNVLGNWTDESAGLPGLGGTDWEADDEMSVTKDANHNIYMTGETEILNHTPNPPQWIVYRRTPAGVYTQFVLHQDLTGETARKRPVVCVDDTNSKLYVFAQVFPEERIVMKSAPLNSLGNLENGSAGETTVLVETGKTFRNTHVPANVTSASDLLVIGDQRTDLKAYWNLVAIP